MKNLLLVSIVFLGLFSSFKKNPTSPLDEVIAAIKASNTNTLSNYLDNTIEIALPDKNDNYNKAQAEIVLKDFFTGANIKNFIVDHKGNNSGSEYCIGTLVTQKVNYRLTIYMKNKAGKAVLQEIRIENKR
jgi:hypothetical protein